LAAMSNYIAQRTVRIIAEVEQVTTACYDKVCVMLSRRPCPN